jgi:hypothetical protein
MRFRPLITTLLAGAALVAGAAQANAASSFAVPASPAAYAAAHAVAVAHWGVDPCAGAVAVSWTTMDESINAAATWSNPTSLFGNAGANYNCAIVYNLHQDWSWPMFCTITEHELGHLAGRDHVNNPNDVMSPFYTRPSPECLHTPAPQASATSTHSAARPAPARAKSRRARARARAARQKHRAA